MTLPLSKNTWNRRQFLKMALWGGAGALVASYPFFIERYAFQINVYKIPVPRLPQSFTNFTIAQLTDLHYGLLMPAFMIERLITKVVQLKTDIIVCTGDYVDQAAEEIDVVWPLLMKLQARRGIYSVLGNHDHWADSDRSLYWLERSGQNLRHRAIPLVNGDERVWLGGAGDLWEDELKIDEMFQNVLEDDCKIVLSHNPDSVDTNFKTKIDLVISGHTHGGQVQLPGIGAPILPVKNYLYSDGFIPAKKTNLFISRGLGWSILPVRFNCFPEVAVLKLVPQQHI